MHWCGIVDVTHQQSPPGWHHSLLLHTAQLHHLLSESLPQGCPMRGKVECKHSNPATILACVFCPPTKILKKDIFWSNFFLNISLNGYTKTWSSNWLFSYKHKKYKNFKIIIESNFHNANTLQNTTQGNIGKFWLWQFGPKKQISHLTSDWPLIRERHLIIFWN